MRQPLAQLALEAAVARLVERRARHAVREIVRGRERVFLVMVVGVAGAVAELLHQLGRRVEDMRGRHQAAGVPRRAHRRLDGQIGRVRFGRGGEVDHGLGQGELAFGAAEPFVSLPRGEDLRQGGGVGQADILGGEADQATGDVARVLAAREHAGELVECRVRVRATELFMQGGDEVVVLLPIAVVEGGRAFRPAKWGRAGGQGGCGELFGHVENGCAFRSGST